MKSFFNPNVQGGLRWLHLHVGLVVAVVLSVAMISTHLPTPAQLPQRPTNIPVITPPVKFKAHAKPIFVQHKSFCQANPQRCRVPSAPSEGAITAAATQSNWYVSPFYTYDTHLNIAPIVNAAGDYYNIWPVYLLAVVFAESGGYQYAWHDWGWPDISGGLTQETVETLGGYGICNDNIGCAQQWEYNATNSIWMGARILRDYMNETGYEYPFLWNAYNTGPGCHCTSPYYYSGFLPNYYRALSYATGQGSFPTPRPTPTPPRFPIEKWKAFTHKVSARHPRGHLRWEAIAWWRGHVDTAHGAVSAPQWFPPTKRRSIGFMTMRFQDERYYWWPGHPGWQKWIRVHHIG